MPEYLAPGVYIKEVPSANKAIQAAPTSTAGMVGLTERGPVGVPIFISSAAQSKRIFGGLLDHTVYTGGQDALPHAMNGFFANGGARVYVVRVLDGAAVQASISLDGGGAECLKVLAQSKGAWVNTVRLTITDRARVTTRLAADAAAVAI
jgi:phage tail sheath protein FI